MGLLIGTMFLSYSLRHVHYVQGVEVLASDRALLLALSWVGISLLAILGPSISKGFARPTHLRCGSLPGLLPLVPA